MEEVHHPCEAESARMGLHIPVASREVHRSSSAVAGDAGNLHLVLARDSRSAAGSHHHTPVLAGESEAQWAPIENVSSPYDCGVVVAEVAAVLDSTRIADEAQL